MTDESATQRPLVCRLNGDDYRNRIKWIEDLAWRALRGYSRDDLKLHLTYSSESHVDVLLMVERERTCCSFLTFVVLHEADAINVTVIAPELVRDSADMLFAPFLAGQPSPDAKRQVGNSDFI